MVAGVYQLTNKVTNDIYVGGSVEVDNTINWYVKSLSEYTISGVLPDWNTDSFRKIASDWLVYGQQSFDWTFLEESKKIKDVVQARKSFWVRKLQPSYNFIVVPLKVSGIYAIKNLSTKECYIGQSTDLSRRWHAHFNILNTSRHYNQHLQQSWNKYGASNFSFEILENCLPDKTILTLLERSWIARTPKVFNVR